MELLLHDLKESKQVDLTPGERLTLAYHDIFDYPLTFPELIKWKATATIRYPLRPIRYKDGFYFLTGREGLIYKRLLKERVSERKMEIARKAAYILSFLPSIKAVLITGALAMGNTKDESDIDLMIIVKKGTLWMSRLASLLLLDLLRIPRRKYGEKNEKDKICLNMWLDEEDLIWRKGKNAYTAHEIAQILPLVNKGQTYEKFIWKNRWIKEYWPNAANIKYEVLSNKYYLNEKKSPRLFKKLLLSPYYLLLRFIETIAFRFQYNYMKSKITREVITPTRALFHPVDWGKVILSRLQT